jgi:hypothetical protein
LIIFRVVGCRCKLYGLCGRYFSLGRFAYHAVIETLIDFVSDRICDQCAEF